MAVSSLLTLIDDIASILDDVAALTKVAAKKTAGVLGDDLALNAEQVSGVKADRELPVVWAVAKGSLRNKAILVPAAIAISAIAPWAVIPLLMLGGAFLCFEGFEKVAHSFLHGKEDTPHLVDLEQDNLSADPVVAEREKIRGAIRTDFILSAEISTIALGTVADAPLMTQLIVLAGTALLMTVGVYGVVAVIVKLDDMGLYLARLPGGSAFARMRRSAGYGLLKAAPALMRLLTVAGTVAMFMVGGGILMHGLAPVHHAAQALAARAGAVPGIGTLFEPVTSMSLDCLFGVLAGAAATAIVVLLQRVSRLRTA